jgi:hypothetical protein
VTTLIIPAAGLSTRYALSRPKFLLQHPSGLTMLSAGLVGIGKYDFDEAIIVSLKRYFSDISEASLSNEVSSVLNCPVKFVLLEEPTASMVDSIAAGIETMSIDGPIVVKDSDNLVALDSNELIGRNFLVYAELEKFTSVKVANKSFVEIDSQGFISNIVEKRIISAEINSGLIGFQSASDFLRAMQKVSGAREKYVSDIVRYLLGDGEVFWGQSASDYIDWGTLIEWKRYCSTFATIFVDIDGVLVTNENPHGNEGKNWFSFRPITENVEPLLQGVNLGKYVAVFTTSRSEKYREGLTKSLSDLGFKNFELILGLPHAKRILINDFAPTNPYPSALAINLERNSTRLAEYLLPLFPPEGF